MNLALLADTGRQAADHVLSGGMPMLQKSA
jgi:hypothetical protein